MQSSKPYQSQAIEGLYSQLSKNLALHEIIENEVRKMGYGQMSVNIFIRNGVADLSTLNIIETKRNRY
jgi:hypothetical protein